MTPEFVHLHTHSEYSLLDGACRIPDLVSRAAELGMTSLALTDHGVMYGAIDFYSNCIEKGIKPIIGCEVYCAPRSRTSKQPKLDGFQYHLVLLAKDITGYRNLLKLVSKGFLEGFYYKPRVDREILAQHSEGLIAMTACLGGEVPELIRTGQPDKAVEALSFYKEVFGPENFYIELQEHGLPEQQFVNPNLIKFSKELGIPLVATNDIHYMSREDAHAHQVLLCIQTSTTVDQPKISFGSDQFYFKTQQEMAEVFPDYPEALANTMEIASRCNLELDFSTLHLPHFEPPEGMTAEAYLEKFCRQNLPRRYPDPTPEVLERLDYELKVINEKGLAGYFLIVSDFVSYAKGNGILVGPGRGSCAGSIVAYLTDVTNIDPLKYGLMFERFLTPGRITMPDFDLDFPDTRREEVVRYVREKYGDDRVAQIVTFGTMGARGAVRDCGRALNMPLADVDRIAKMVPETLNITLEEALKTSLDLQEAYAKEEPVRNLVDTARTIEGLARHSSVHAAGILITRDPLDDHVPLQRSNEGDIRTAGFDMTMVAKIGLLKTDFLGLRTLTVIDDCIKMVQRNRGITIDLDSIPFDDEKALKLLQAGDTAGVFQLESNGMRQLLKDLKPERFEDLIPVVALFRPGPLGSGMVSDFVDRKRGRKPVEHIHPKCEPILEDTYGILLYQEQVMRIAMELASFPVVEADTLRSAMGKKKHDKIAQLRPVFIEGAVKNGVEQKDAETIYDLMANFGSYGFNKSHTTCYAVIAYQTAYLKANYSAEYMAALLTSIMDTKSKVAMYVDDCRHMKLTILPPDINKSEVAFSVEPSTSSSRPGSAQAGHGGDIRFGLEAIKNVGRGVIEDILAARNEEGDFRSLHEFCRRVCDSSVTRSAVECLVKAGAFDSINKNRAQLLFVVEDAMGRAARERRDRLNGQVSLFGNAPEESSAEPENLPNVTELSRDEMLAMEKDLLGLYLSDHPLLQYRDTLEKVVSATSEDLKDKAEREEVTVGGVIARVRKLTTKKNEPMAFVTVEDFEGPIDVTVFPDAYKECVKWLEADGIVVVKGRINRRARTKSKDEGSEASVGIICESVTPLANVQKPNGQSGRNGNGNGTPKSVNIRVGGVSRDRLQDLRKVLGESSGESPVYFHLPSNGSMAKVKIEVKVDPSPKLLSEIEQVVGKEVVWLE